MYQKVQFPHVELLVVVSSMQIAVAVLFQLLLYQ